MTPQRGGVRPAALAGRWYPGDPQALRAAVRGYLDAAPAAPVGLDVRAVITPHAGFIYSGPTAGVAWRTVAGQLARRRVRRIVLVGPAHRVPFWGMALGDYAAWRVPTGEVPVDREALAELEAAGLGSWVPNAHVEEHCLEIELPFLIEIASAGGAGGNGGDRARIPIVPLLMGQTDHAHATRAIEAVLGPDDLLVVSSDLSHYLPYDVARQKDLGTLDRILALEPGRLGGEEACGHRGIGAGLELARRRGWVARLLDYRSSGDTAGDRDAVVGYGAVALGCPAVGSGVMSKA